VQWAAQAGGHRRLQETLRDRGRVARADGAKVSGNPDMGGYSGQEATVGRS
jgi:hypothetical protein